MINENSCRTETQKEKEEDRSRGEQLVPATKKLARETINCASSGERAIFNPESSAFFEVMQAICLLSFHSIIFIIFYRILRWYVWSKVRSSGLLLKKISSIEQSFSYYSSQYRPSTGRDNGGHTKFFAMVSQWNVGREESLYSLVSEEKRSSSGYTRAR